ncbi:LOW QUALITY PROTEIN: protein tyrosine phosphatase domain-containing protein 1-like [Amphiura filiformis]|uniref:LOW QUALITY PROTEIN: protein tyrosine phosphatase domain-containing protein 1-like n=1 Tax=Amphiura filiformis TaxID=82378 RepID=UPI003B220808
MSRQKEGDPWSSSAGTGSHISSTVRPTAKYNPLSDSLRQMTSGGFSCSMFCGGKTCKYESGTYWRDDQMAIKGLYSSWVTDSILAMARPNTENIAKYDIVKQFKKQGIRSVINLQRPGEHASCGRPLEPDEFSYVPQTFMDNDIFFYNFGWDDYGVQSLHSILDMVKVMSFAITQGKVAVHCHAGLGRTGVLIACYLVYSRRMDGDHAITYVREKRQGAIQTKGQIECATAFSQFLIPLRVVFSSCDPSAYPYTLDQYLNRQKLMLHGLESRELKYIPKVVKTVCTRLQELAKCLEAQPESPRENIDIVKKLPQGISKSPVTNLMVTARQMFESSSSTLRSSSMEDVNSESLLYPDKPNQGHVSPLLDLRKKMQSQRIGETAGSDEDEESDMKPTKGLSKHAPRTADSRDFTKTKNLPGGHRVTKMPMHRLSSSSLVHNGSLENFDEIYMVAKALMFDLDTFDEGDDVDNPGGVVQSLKARVASLQQNLNVSESAWQIVMTEEDPFVLCLLMWSWLEHLKEPFLSPAEATKLVNSDDDAVGAFKSLKKGPKYTLECILKLVACLQPIDRDLEDAMLYRVIQAVCHIPHEELQKSPETPSDDEDEDDNGSESFYASQLLLYLRQYVFHLRLRISNSGSRLPRRKKLSCPGALSEEAEVKNLQQTHANGKHHASTGGSRSLKEEESDEVDNMPIPVTRKSKLPPIF